MTRLRSLMVWLMLNAGWAAAQSGNPAPPPLPPPVCDSTLPSFNEVLARVPVEFEIFSSRTASSCYPDELYGSGTVGADELQRLLRRAGYDVRVIVNTAPPKVFPPASGPTWPVSAEVEAIVPQKPGARLKIDVKLRNWTVFNQELSWGLRSLNYILLNERGEVVNWSGDGPRTLLAPPPALCPAFQTCDAPAIYLSLNHFNPALHLEPGRYTLRLRIEGVSFDSGTLAVTLPDQHFGIVP
ncbi:hypothetical protein [Deinococcus sp.]|uniref:hypothetical protein n=1 Tax=Deinococcus sp. TaxID=47478 RepID=UPI0025F34B9F|nr:hypothetical protein [Deinococcus sp.]